jgi:DNA-binding SARP family transcriptional activator/tetratricopeptide (TPR) repeat protein
MEGTTRVRLLGAVQVERDGVPVRGFRSRKALALLGYLAVQDQPVSRERLVDLLWEEKTESQGRNNLSWVLSKISSLLPDVLQTDRHTVQFQPAVPCWLDTAAFAELEAEGNITSLASAVELYRGEFLEGLYFEGCAEFELWVVGERERWRQRAVSVLRELVAHHGLRGEYEEGVRFAQRSLALEPWREETHREVMRLLAWSGQRGAALAQYETCRQARADELGVEPAPETTALYQQIRDGELEVPVLIPPSPYPTPAFLGEKPPAAERPVFVARESELAKLDGLLHKALAGQGQVAFVTGVAGQGKTALLQEFARRAQAAHPDLVVASGNGNAHTGVGDPYLPFREILSLLTGDVESRWAAGAMSGDQARRLWHTFPLAAQALVEVGPDLIDLFVPGVALVRRATVFTLNGAGWLPRLRELVKRRATLPPDPNLQQSALFEQYTRVVRALAQQRPLLLVLDDLQWADGGSTNLLFHLGKRIEGSRALIVGAYRPEEVALGRQGERHPLEPVVNEFQRDFGDIVANLGQAGDRRFVDALLDTESNRLSDAFRETLYRQTRGHPLFTVELLRGMQERGDLIQDQEGRWAEGASLDWERLPARVEAVIAERIGRLSQGLRDILAVAGVEGETFTAEVVARVRGIDEQEVVRRLSGELDKRHRLVRAQGLQQLEAAHLSCYRFRHILFQRYLYNSLDPVERAHLHRAVGTALEALYEAEKVEIIAVIAPELARHFQEAGITEKAVAYLHQAGARAVRMSAHEEAIAHFNRALALLEIAPDTPERAQQELELQVALLAPLQVARGPGAPELGRSCDRARELCAQVSSRTSVVSAQPNGSPPGEGEKTPRVFAVLAQLALFYELQGTHRTAHEIGEQLLSMAERAGAPLLLVWGHLLLGMITTYLGELGRARVHLEHVIAVYDPQLHHSLACSFGPDIGVYGLSLAAAVLWLLGHPDQGLRRSQEAIALAQTLSHPYSLALSHGVAGWFHVFRRDARSAQEHAEASIWFSTEYGFPYFSAMGRIIRSWALTEQGQGEEGIAAIRQGIADYGATGAGLGQPHHFAMLAEACGRAGQTEEGLDFLAEALVAMHRNGECWCEAKIHVVQGELLWMRGADEAEVEMCFQRAIQVACQQQAKSWELRAVISLCRLWQKQGKRKEAQKRLAEVYNWFSEGFDTPDLQEAESLLETLS